MTTLAQRQPKVLANPLKSIVTEKGMAFFSGPTPLAGHSFIPLLPSQLPLELTEKAPPPSLLVG